MLNRLFERQLNAVVLRPCALFNALESVKIGLPHRRFRIAVGFFDIEKDIEERLFLFQSVAFVLDKCLNGVFKLAVQGLVFTH